MNFRIFGWSIAITLASLVVAFLYGGPMGLFTCVILGVLEVSLSFDNAVVNAKILERMSPKWQQIFLTVGVAIAVFGMRLLFPLLVVGISASLGPWEALQLSLRGGDVDTPGTYAHILHDAHPQIAAFGGAFLMMLFLDFVFEERDVRWLTWLERPLAKLGQLKHLPVVVTLLAVLLTAQFLAAEPGRVLSSGVWGALVYLVVGGLSSLFESKMTHDSARYSARGVRQATGKAAFFLFLYLEVLDASFSFDGVVGAFAITNDPIIIALGLGLIGAMFVRSLTVFMVKKGTLHELVYLEHGAHWAIGALALIMLISVRVEIPEVITGSIGAVLIAASWWSSVRRNRRLNPDVSAMQI